MLASGGSRMSSAYKGRIAGINKLRRRRKSFGMAGFMPGRWVCGRRPNRTRPLISSPMKAAGQSDEAAQYIAYGLPNKEPPASTGPAAERPPDPPEICPRKLPRYRLLDRHLRGADDALQRLAGEVVGPKRNRERAGPASTCLMSPGAETGETDEWPPSFTLTAFPRRSAPSRW